MQKETKEDEQKAEGKETRMEKELPIFSIYEKALRPADFRTMFRDAKRAGYDAIEFSVDSTDARLARLDWTAAQMEELRRTAWEEDLRILTMCLSGHKRFSLGHPDPAVRAQGLVIMEKALCFSERVGIRVIQLSGFDVFDERLRTAETRKRYEENVAKAARMAAHCCVTLAIEPVEGNLLDVKSTMEVVEKVDSPFLQVYPDPANILSLGIDPIRDLEFGKGHIAAVHMRDSLPGIFDATIPFGTGCLDFDAVLRKLDELDFSGPMIVEMWNEERADYMDYIRQARDYLEEHIRKVRRDDV